MTSFSYSANKSKKNTVWEIPCGINIRNEFSTNKYLQSLMERTQPRSIYDPISNQLICYQGEARCHKMAIVIPDSYEFFLAPWIAETVSYPCTSVRRDWKHWFPLGHLYKKFPGGETNFIEDHRFDGTQLQNNLEYCFFLKYHQDADNYWHWLYEWVPRLLILREIQEQNNLLIPRIKFFTTGTFLNNFQKEWVKLLLGKLPAYEMTTKPLSCYNLITIRPPFPYHHCRSSISKLRKTLLEIPNAHNNKGRRIYLMRGITRNRRMLINENEIIKLLADFSFEPYSMDELTIKEQASLFDQSDFIVGPHGAAFANIIFCKPKTRILELFGRSYVTAHGAALSHSCDLRWCALEGNGETNTLNFRVDPNELMRIVQALLAEG